MIQRPPRRTGAFPPATTRSFTPIHARARLGRGLCLGILVLACALLGLPAPGAALAHNTPPAPQSPTPAAWRPATVLVQVCAPTNLTLSDTGSTILRADNALAPTLAAWGLTQAAEITPGSGVYRLQGAPGLDVAGAVAALAQVGVVLYAEPDYRVQADLLPNDADYAQYQWALPQIQAPAAWDVTTGSPDIILASLDTGVALDHPDLAAKLLPGTDIVNNDAVPYDDNGHGTYTSGIMAAESNNSTGVAGVCWGCRVLPVKVLDSQGGGNVSDFARGMRWAVDHGARVINVSAGVEYTTKTMSDAVQYALQHNVVVVASAGNTPDGKPRWPAAYEGVIAVSASDRNDVIADFASYGDFLDLTAPGVDILSSVWSQGRLTYAWGSGTSSAAPFVSGAAGLLLSVNANLTPQQVKGALQDSADDLGPKGWDPHYGWGRLNIARALARIGAVPPTVAPTHTLAPSAPSPTPAPPTATATAPPTVAPPPTPGNTGGTQLEVIPGSAAPGSSITYVGTGFAPNELVGLRLVRPDQTNRYLSAVLADASGAFRSILTLPDDTPAGAATALAQGTQSGRQATAPLQVGGTPLLPTPQQTPPQIILPPATLVPVTPQPVPAQVAFSPVPAVPDTADQRFFSAVGHTLRQPFLAYWQAHGGLPIFGYPLSEPFSELNPADGRTYVVQYFERNRFEYHPEFAGTPYAVLLGLLGHDVTVGRTFDPATPFTSDATHLYFPATGHSLGRPFLAYWQAHGGLAIFGYPLSEEIQEDGVTVQYFERNRFELHPEYAGTPYEVELGLLGVTVARDRGLLR